MHIKIYFSNSEIITSLFLYGGPFAITVEVGNLNWEHFIKTILCAWL